MYVIEGSVDVITKVNVAVVVVVKTESVAVVEVPPVSVWCFLR